VYSHVLEKVVSDWARSSEAKTRMQS
jgi:hypothetical protein